MSTTNEKVDGEQFCRCGHKRKFHDSIACRKHHAVRPCYTFDPAEESVPTNEKVERCAKCGLPPDPTRPPHAVPAILSKRWGGCHACNAPDPTHGIVPHEPKCHAFVPTETAAAGERETDHQCAGYAGDPGASAPRRESYQGHPGPCFIRPLVARPAPDLKQAAEEIAGHLMMHHRISGPRLCNDIPRACALSILTKHFGGER